MIMVISNPEVQIMRDKVNKLRKQYNHLVEQLKPTYAADSIILENASFFSSHLDQLEKALGFISSTNQNTAPPSMLQHPLSYDNIRQAQGWKDHAVVDAVRQWRRSLSKTSYNTISFTEKKEVFDYFFRHDVHGHLKNDETIFLSRGIADPEYYIPPSIVKIALHVSSKHNWFGYADSLGHEETRQAITDLEKIRRNINSISYKNCAVVMGGTAGLHAVLSMISKQEKRRKCVVLTPNYAPIIDDIQQHFEILPVSINHDYTVNIQDLSKALNNDEVAAFVLSSPHNPSSLKNADDVIKMAMNISKSKNMYFLFDEILFSGNTLTKEDIDNDFFVSINSYSKAYSVPGLKLGHIIASENFINKFYRHASTSYGSPPSFLYLTSTLLSISEANYRKNDICVPLPDQVTTIASCQSIIQYDFNLWCDLLSLTQEVNRFIVFQALSSRDICHNNYFGLQDTSPNFVLRCNDNTSAYETMLKIMHGSNISVIPAECFVPPENWPCDLRITYMMSPEKLISAITKMMSILKDSITKSDTKESLKAVTV